MNCEQFQRRLLETLDPDEPSTEVSAHLTACPACHAWHKQLARIERHVPLLPVPESETKADFLKRVLNDAVPLAPPPVRQPSRQWLRKPVLLRVGGIAAAVALIVGGLLYLNPFASRGPVEPQANARIREKNRTPQPPPELAPKETLVARLTECDLRLAEAGTPRARVQTLADLADALRDEAKVLGQAAAPEALETVTLLYRKVVQDGIVSRARVLPAHERREVLAPIAARLEQVQGDVEVVARAAGPSSSADRLRELGSSARDAGSQLRTLVQGGTP